MSGDRKRLADPVVIDRRIRWSEPLLADEQPFDRRSQLRLAAWGTSSIAGMVIAFLCLHTAGTSSMQEAATHNSAIALSQQVADVARQADEASRRLALAVEQLNSDRDRLFTRVTAIETDVSGVRTGLANQQAALKTYAERMTAALKPAGSPVAAAPAPVAETRAAPVASITPPKPAATTVAQLGVKPDAYLFSLTPLSDATGSVRKNDRALGAAIATTAAAETPASAKLAPPAPVNASRTAPPSVTQPALAAEPEPALTSISNEALALPAAPVRKAQYGLDLGGATTIEGVRVLWVNTTRSTPQIKTLQPVVKLRERPGRQGIQLRLVAGPLPNVAEAARQCAIVSAQGKPCETTVYEGQSLPERAETVATDAATPVPKPAVRRRVAAPTVVVPAIPPAPAAEPEPSEQVAERRPAGPFGNFFAPR